MEKMAIGASQDEASDSGIGSRWHIQNETARITTPDSSEVT